MANINGNEIYFGIIGEINSGAPAGVHIAIFDGTAEGSVQGQSQRALALFGNYESEEETEVQQQEQETEPEGEN